MRFGIRLQGWFASSNSRPIRLIGWNLLLLLVTVSNAALSDDLSGPYFGERSNFAIMLELARTSDGNVTGHYEQVSLSDTGEVARFNAVVTGVFDGRTAILNIRPLDPLSTTAVVS